jgi:hypothetical protein
MMQGSSMFIIYQDGNGNVTLSTRAGTGHSQPQYEARPDVELIEGSGVEGSDMVANIRCSSGCDGLDVTGSTDWIAAWRSGDALDSAETDANIRQHDGMNRFSLDMSQASVTSSENPFLSTDDGESGNGNGSGSGDDTQGGGSGGGGGGSGAVTDNGTGQPSSTVIAAHGIVMSIAFVILYPLGAILMPVIGKWFIHASWQLIAFLLMWAGFGLGYYLADHEGVVS